ncbi:hypothetical protein D9619_012708 [Psilocybe cf. subviscida]|uniref:F-box domain-containing protein n=1 Tax=Psilocybe cf. subviscida TaxID=2480587 RepID=A0A8H5AQF5_9AGAR|nr:hypothetical protein D9619_012708 [Psilocybe cf. subviscida]
MTPPRLPTDILPHILANILPVLDLCSISLVSREFRTEAQRIVFRHPGPVTIAYWNKPHIGLLKTIISSPNRLALHVRSWDQEIVLWERCSKRTKAALIHLTKRALESMVNLKSLRVWSAHPVSIQKALPPLLWPLPHILLDCKFQLEVFEWECNSGDEEGLITDFLPAQRGLKELVLPFNRNRPDVFDSALYTAASRVNLDLESYAGTVEMTAPFLTRTSTDNHGTSLKCLRWTDGPSTNGDLDLDGVAPALNNLRILHFDYDPMQFGPHFSQLGVFAHTVTLVRASS